MCLHAGSPKKNYALRSSESEQCLERALHLQTFHGFATAPL